MRTSKWQKDKKEKEDKSKAETTKTVQETKRQLSDNEYP